MSRPHPQPSLQPQLQLQPQLLPPQELLPQQQQSTMMMRMIHRQELLFPLHIICHLALRHSMRQALQESLTIEKISQRGNKHRDLRPFPFVGAEETGGSYV